MRKKVRGKSVSRTVALEEAFLHPRVWDLFPESLRQRYRPVRTRLSDVGANRIRQMDAAGIDLQVLSHVQPGVQMIPNEQADLAISVCREVNDWLAAAIAAYQRGSAPSRCCPPSPRERLRMNYNAR